jgi:hypothetical protein
MAWAVERTKQDSSPRFLACYRDPDGRARPAGRYPTHQLPSAAHPLQLVHA